MKESILNLRKRGDFFHFILKRYFFRTRNYSSFQPKAAQKGKLSKNARRRQSMRALQADQAREEGI